MEGIDVQSLALLSIVTSAILLMSIMSQFYLFMEIGRYLKKDIHNEIFCLACTKLDTHFQLYTEILSLLFVAVSPRFID